MRKRKITEVINAAPEQAKVATLWVFQKDSGGQLPCLCTRSSRSKYMLCVTAGGGGRPVRVVKRPVEEFGTCRLVNKGGAPYPAAESIDKLEEIGRRTGITAAAAKVLLAAREKAIINEDEYNDEEEIGKMASETPATAGDSKNDSPVPNEDTTMSKKTKTTKTKPAKAVKAKPAAKKTAAPAKATKAVKAKAAPKKAAAPKGPSRISKAVEWMSAEVKKAGGHDKLERGFRKELIEKAAAKFDLAVGTCSIQYNKQVVGK